jgi:hypothetical protein
MDQCQDLYVVGDNKNKKNEQFLKVYRNGIPVRDFSNLAVPYQTLVPFHKPGEPWGALLALKKPSGSSVLKVCPKDAQPQWNECWCAGEAKLEAIAVLGARGEVVGIKADGTIGRLEGVGTGNYEYVPWNAKSPSEKLPGKVLQLMGGKSHLYALCNASDGETERKGLLYYQEIDSGVWRRVPEIDLESLVGEDNQERVFGLKTDTKCLVVMEWQPNGQLQKLVSIALGHEVRKVAVGGNSACSLIYSNGEYILKDLRNQIRWWLWCHKFDWFFSVPQCPEEKTAPPSKKSVDRREKKKGGDNEREGH